MSNTSVVSGEVQRDRTMFSRAQYDLLNRMFPEFIGTANSTESERTFHAGQRQVVEVVRTRVNV